MFSYFLYRFAQFLVIHLPLKFRYGLADFISDLHAWFSPRERRWVRNNLRVILNSEKNLDHMAREVFKNFGRYLADFLRTPLLNKNNLGDYINVENVHYIDQELKKGKGAIIISAHMGNWEWGGVAMAVKGYPVMVVALEHKSNLVNNFFITQRAIQGVQVTNLKNAGKKCLEALKNNQLIALVADRDFSPAGVVAKFFGRDMLIPKGPAVFSRRHNTAIVPGFVVRQEDGRFKLIFEKPIYPEVTENEEEDIKNTTQKYVKEIEWYVRKYPTQWLVFREFWLK